MKPTQQSSSGGNKGPRWPCNSKKPVRNLNLSGSKSFLNFSRRTSAYVADLRNNNTKLAHALAIEKSKTAMMFKRNSDYENHLMQQRAAARKASQMLTMGLNKFSSALDLMTEFSSYASQAKDIILSLCPEFQHTATPPPSRAAETSSGTDVNPVSAHSSTTSKKDLPDRFRRHGEVKPTIKGHLISKPSILLHRVAVPTRLGGKGLPPRGRNVTEDISVTPRNHLSDVEEVAETSPHNNSNCGKYGETAKSPAEASSWREPTPSLPESHVILERITAPESRQSLPPEDVTDKDQLTVVNFGSMNFSNFSLPHPGSEEIGSPRKRHSLGSSEVKQNSAGVQETQIHILESSLDDYMTDSSSDDDVTLQLLESKKSLLKKKRQADCKEGTSWNYDESGRYRDKPPRKRKAAADSSSPSHPLKASKRQAEERGKSKEGKSARNKKETKEFGNDVHPSKESPGIKTKEMASNSGMWDTTIYDDKDVSLTCVTPPSTVLKEQFVTNEFSDKGCYINHRSRRRRSPVNEKSSSNLSEESHEIPNLLNAAPNIENVSSRESFVVLQRLPTCYEVHHSNIVDAGRDTHEKEPEKESEHPEESIRVSSKHIERTKVDEPGQEVRLNPLSQLAQSTDTEEYEMQVFKELTLPKRKQEPDRSPVFSWKKKGNTTRKYRKKCSPEYLSVPLNAQESSAAQTSPGSASESGSMKSINCSGSIQNRPKRNAAPTSLKEPRLGT